MADINPHERRAQALAEITQMQQENVELKQQVDRLQSEMRDRETVLQREINKQQVRAEIAEEDRTKYRAESHLYRGKMIELATTISHIRRATDAAEKISATANAILHGETLDELETEQREAQDLVASIERLDDHQKAGAEQSMAEFEQEFERLIGRPMGHVEEPRLPAQKTN